MLVTVFTPTYNRAYRLPDLYASLCNQTCSDFEWLIVDDGSTDNTAQLAEQWIDEAKITIRYVSQSNGGKHRAINRGAREAAGDWFFIVDSDDQLTPDAIEWLKQQTSLIGDNPKFVGLSGTCVTADGKKVGGDNAFGIIDASPLDFRLKHKVRGDMTEVVRTSAINQFPFPEFEGEKFCPEALVWNRIGLNRLFRWVDYGIYVCEYLPDGLTAKIVKIRRNSPRASALYYSEYTNMPIPFAHRLKGAINFWRFYTPAAKEYKRNISMMLRLLGYLPGKLMRLNDNRK